MTEEQHFENQQELHAKQLSELTADVSSLSADVRTLMEGQKIVQTRINRPPQWGIFATFAGVIFMIMGLLINGLKENVEKIEHHIALDITRNLELHMWMRDKIDINNEALSSNQTDLEWLKKLEDRSNRRVHREAMK